MPDREYVDINSSRKTARLSKDNPYVALSTDDPDEGRPNQNEETTDNTAFIYAGEYIVNIPTELIQKAVEIEKYSCPVKFICLLDFSINLYYMVYGYIFGLFFACASFLGYLSTIYHSRKYLCCYLGYQYLQTLGKLLNLLLVISVGISINNTNESNSFNNTSLYKMDMENYTYAIIISILLLVCQAYITIFIHKYYRLLPTTREQQMLLRRTVSSL